MRFYICIVYTRACNNKNTLKKTRKKWKKNKAYENTPFIIFPKYFTFINLQNCFCFSVVYVLPSRSQAKVKRHSAITEMFFFFNSERFCWFYCDVGFFLPVCEQFFDRKSNIRDFSCNILDIVGVLRKSFFGFFKKFSW